MGNTDNWTDTFDILIVGGGGAGMAAAVSAAQVDPSLDICLLHKEDELGGATTMSVGGFTAGDTYLQRRKGIDDSIRMYRQDREKFIDHYAQRTGRDFHLDFEGDLSEKDDEELAELMLRSGAKTLDWLRELGCEFAGPHPESPNRLPRLHVIPDTDDYVKILTEHMNRYDVSVRRNREVRSLVTTDGAVNGVVADRGDSSGSLRLRAHMGVILATGGYSNSRELRDRFTTDSEAEAINESETGDGHRMAREAGARLVNMDIQWLTLRCGDPLYTAPRIPRLVDEGAILVNQSGRRFMDEVAEYDQLFTSALEQSDDEVYVLFDDRIARQFTAWPDPISTFPGEAGWGYVDDYLETDYLVRHDDADGIADGLEADEQTLRETLRQYDRAADGETIDKYGRTEFEQPLSESPLYLLGPVYPYVVVTDGGASVNKQFEVLDENHAPVEGLFAAGSVAGGPLLVGHGHHHSWIFTSGRIAGREVAHQST